MNIFFFESLFYIYSPPRKTIASKINLNQFYVSFNIELCNKRVPPTVSRFVVETKNNFTIREVERGEMQAVNFNNVGQPCCVLQPRNSIVIPANGRPPSSLCVFACAFATRFNSDAAASSASFAIQRLVPLLLAVTRELIFGPPYKNANRINRGRNYYVSLRATTKRVIMASSAFTWRWREVGRAYYLRFGFGEKS